MHSNGNNNLGGTMSTALVRNRLDSFMKPTRNELFYPLQQVFDRFFDEFYSDLSPSSIKAKAGFPRWDIYQTDTTWNVELCVNGCDVNDVNVEILPADQTSGYERMLKISGRVSEEHQIDEKAQYYIRELRRSAFERSVYLPNNITGDPEAVMKNGILKLTWNLPDKPIPKIKKIEIKSD